MNLTESEKRLAYQIESTDQIGTLHELAMMNRYTRKPEIKEATESLLTKLRSLSADECMAVVCDVQKNPNLEEPEQENPAQLNTKKSSNQPLKKDLSSTDISIPIRSNPLEGEPLAADGIGTDTRSAREIYREIILENIEYESLCQTHWIERDRLDEIVELMKNNIKNCKNNENVKNCS